MSGKYTNKRKLTGKRKASVSSKKSRKYRRRRSKSSSITSSINESSKESSTLTEESIKSSIDDKIKNYDTNEKSELEKALFYFFRNNKKTDESLEMSPSSQISEITMETEIPGKYYYPFESIQVINNNIDAYLKKYEEFKQGITSVLRIDTSAINKFKEYLNTVSENIKNVNNMIIEKFKPKTFSKRYIEKIYKTREEKQKDVTEKLKGKLIILGDIYVEYLTEINKNTSIIDDEEIEFNKNFLEKIDNCLTKFDEFLDNHKGNISYFDNLLSKVSVANTAIQGQIQKIKQDENKLILYKKEDIYLDKQVLNDVVEKIDEKIQGGKQRKNKK
jgi:hypothetical protein